jgi:hypothetical protein
MFNFQSSRRGRRLLVPFFLLSVYCSLYSSVSAQEKVNEVVKARYALGREHSKDPQSFMMQSKLVQLAPDGSRKDSTIYTLHLICRPGKNSKDGDEYTCTRFTVRSNNGPDVSIPALANWKYVYKVTENAKDEKGQVFGIDHAKFEKIVDSNGQTLAIEKTYHVYNAFIDFHALQLFADSSPAGKGVQDLHKIGDKIVHSSAFSEPPVNLGKEIKEGSVFKNGEITLELKGIGTMNNRACALLGYDSGNSSFKMLMEPMPNMQVNTTGSSHYWGDIYKDLQSGWIQLALLNEIVVSETIIGGQPNKVHSVIERRIEVRNIAKPSNTSQN